MLKRIIFGGVMIAALVGLFYVDWRLESGYPRSSFRLLPTAVVLLALVVAAYRELSRLAEACQIKLLAVSGLVGSVALATTPYWLGLQRQYLPLARPPAPDAAVMVVLSAIVLAVFAEQMIRHRTEGAMVRIAATLLAVLYLGVGGALILMIRVQGVGFLVLFLAAVKCTDIGAYFTGSAIGKHKMIPWLSPGKTWEGLAGGLVLSSAVAVIATLALGLTGRLTLVSAAIFGPIVGAAGQFGDLCESLLKRSAQQKDSGSIVPEFGGVLDIIDSPLLAAPVALVLLNVLS